MEREATPAVTAVKRIRMDGVLLQICANGVPCVQLVCMCAYNWGIYMLCVIAGLGNASIHVTTL